MLRPIDQRRAEVPALHGDEIYFDSPGGTQLPQPVIDAIDDALHRRMSNSGWHYPASQRSTTVVAEARRAIADLFGAEPEGVIFGPSMTSLTFRMAETLSQDWHAHDNIVISELEHDANAGPWVHHAGRIGVDVRIARIDPATGELPTDQYDDLIDDRTRLVAVTAASNAIGTRPDLPMIIASARRHSRAYTYVDAVHATAHTAVDLATIGADFIACSPYKFFGPHVGSLISDPATLEALHPPRLRPQANTVPVRFEHGTLPFEQLAGVTAAVDYLAGLTTSTGTRRERLRLALADVSAYVDPLFERLYGQLRQIESVSVLGHAAQRSPTLSLTIGSLDPNSVAAELAQQQLAVSSGGFFAYELMRALGLPAAVRVGLSHLTTESEIDVLVGAIQQLAASEPTHSTPSRQARPSHTKEPQ